MLDLPGSTGVDHVGLAPTSTGDPSVVDRLIDVSRYPNMHLELARRGWAVDELRKVAGENLLGVPERPSALLLGDDAHRPPTGRCRST